MDKRPILSICIPTYNRCQYLEQALESYVNNTAFDDEVELVISDNASTDNTQSLCERYASKCRNIKYFRNKENVRDSNFCLALDRAEGEYIKLMNDNLLITSSGLGYLKEIVRKEITDKRPIFFTNGIYAGGNHSDTPFCCFEEFVTNMSFIVTAILTFGAWKEDWEKVKEPTKYTALQLNQDDWAYQIVERKSCGCIYREQYCEGIVIDKTYRTGYNWFKVHISNYYNILEPYIEKGLVSKGALIKEKTFYLKNLKNEIVSKYIYKIRPDFNFDLSGTTKILWDAFREVPYFYLMMLTLPLWGSYKVLMYFIKERVSNNY